MPEVARTLATQMRSIALGSHRWSTTSRGLMTICACAPPDVCGRITLLSWMRSRREGLRCGSGRTQNGGPSSPSTCVMRCPSLSNPAARALASTLVTGWARSASVARKKSITSGSARRRIIQDIIWPESHRCEPNCLSRNVGRCDQIPRSSSVKTARLRILLLSLASPRTGGPHACHYRTAGSDSCARRRGGRVAARGARN